MKISKLESCPLVALSAGQGTLGQSDTKTWVKVKGAFMEYVKVTCVVWNSLKRQLKQTLGSHFFLALLFCFHLPSVSWSPEKKNFKFNG